jgi:hypothetical protein
MYLKKSTNLKTGRTQLSAVHGFRDPITKKVRTKVIETFGYLDILEKQYEDPLAHFAEEVGKMNKQYENDKEITITLSSLDRIDVKEKPMCLGYFPFSRLFHEMEIDAFLNNFQSDRKIGYSLSKILQLLVYCRLLFPGSKARAFDKKDVFFEKFDFSLDDIYRSLSHFCDIKDKLQMHLYEMARARHGARPHLLYYDVTNYYFELDSEDDLKKRGVSKEHRPEPIVQMGLMMDQDSIPIAYRLFPGNTNDCETLRPMINSFQESLNAKRVIIVADRGINTYKNIISCILNHNGYVFSQSIRKAHKELKDYVFDEQGYKVFGSGFKIKSRVYPKEVTLTDMCGRQKKVRIDEKQVVFYDPEYAERARAERSESVRKAYDLIADPSRYNKSTFFGAARFIDNLSFDKETGEVLTGRVLSFNREKLAEEEMYDGYYSIVTSELDKSADEIIEIYRGLWKIEESFKITKTNLETRPVYVSREDHIEGHFLTCFISLLFIRLLENQISGSHSVSSILESLRKYEVSHLDSNFYKTIYYDKVLEDIGDSLGLTLNQKTVTRGQIKNFLAMQKKRKNTTHF